MKYPNNYTKLPKNELKTVLKNLEEELEEIEFERRMTLGQSGVHLGAMEVQRLIAEFDKDKKRIEEQKAQVEEVLKIKE